VKKKGKCEESANSEVELMRDSGEGDGFAEAGGGGYFVPFMLKGEWPCGMKIEPSGKRDEKANMITDSSPFGRTGKG